MGMRLCIEEDLSHRRAHRRAYRPDQTQARAHSEREQIYAPSSTWSKFHVFNILKSLSGFVRSKIAGDETSRAGRGDRICQLISRYRALLACKAFARSKLASTRLALQGLKVTPFQYKSNTSGENK